MKSSKTTNDIRRLIYIDSASGRIQGARFVPSPNYDMRPEGSSIDLLIIHSISLPPDQFGGSDIEHFFCNKLNFSANPCYREIKDLQVSAHVLIRRDGELVQFVPLHQRAWHAGQSYCEGRTRINDFSIGIELEGSDNVPFENVQYESLIALTHAIHEAYPAITPSRIYGHSDIAPGRKTDPGPFFNWKHYLSACY